MRTVILPSLTSCPLFEAVLATRHGHDVAQDLDQYVIREVHEVLALFDLIRFFYFPIDPGNFAIFTEFEAAEAVAPLILVAGALDAVAHAADAVLLAALGLQSFLLLLLCPLHGATAY